MTLENSSVKTKKQYSKQGNEIWLVNEGWRWMFFSGAIPAGMFLILLIFVPETPRYLVMNGKEDKALKVLNRISGTDNAPTILKKIKGTRFHAYVYGFFRNELGACHMGSTFRNFPEQYTWCHVNCSVCTMDCKLVGIPYIPDHE